LLDSLHLEISMTRTPKKNALIFNENNITGVEFEAATRTPDLESLQRTEDSTPTARRHLTAAENSTPTTRRHLTAAEKKQVLLGGYGVSHNIIASQMRVPPEISTVRSSTQKNAAAAPAESDINSDSIEETCSMAIKLDILQQQNDISFDPDCETSRQLQYLLDQNAEFKNLQKLQKMDKKEIGRLKELVFSKEETLNELRREILQKDKAYERLKIAYQEVLEEVQKFKRQETTGNRVPVTEPMLESQRNTEQMVQRTEHMVQQLFKSQQGMQTLLTSFAKEKKDAKEMEQLKCQLTHLSSPNSFTVIEDICAKNSTVARQIYKDEFDTADVMNFFRSFRADTEEMKDCKYLLNMTPQTLLGHKKTPKEFAKVLMKLFPNEDVWVQLRRLKAKVQEKLLPSILSHYIDTRIDSSKKERVIERVEAGEITRKVPAKNKSKYNSWIEMQKSQAHDTNKINYAVCELVHMDKLKSKKNGKGNNTKDINLDTTNCGEDLESSMIIPGTQANISNPTNSRCEARRMAKKRSSINETDDETENTMESLYDTEARRMAKKRGSISDETGDETEESMDNSDDTEKGFLTSTASVLYPETYDQESQNLLTGSEYDWDPTLHSLRPKHRQVNAVADI